MQPSPFSRMATSTLTFGSRTEQFHELNFTITGTGFGTKDAEDGGSLVSSGDWVRMDLGNLALHPEAVGGMGETMSFQI